MKSRSLFTKTLFVTALALPFTACTSDVLVDGSEPSSEETFEAAATTTVAFETIEDLDVEIKSSRPAGKVFTSAAAYAREYGHVPPGVVQGEWIAVYSAGMLTSDGHKLSVKSIKVVPASEPGKYLLRVTTSLESPGAGCDVHALPELPYVVVKFKAPTPRPQYVSFPRQDALTDCTTPTPPPTEIAADCRTRRGGAFVTIENADSADERFTTWATDAAFITEAKRLLAAGERRVPTFIVQQGTDCDGKYSFHLDPRDVGFADFTIEICDAVPSYIQNNLTDWMKMTPPRWCPWSGRVIAVDDRR